MAIKAETVYVEIDAKTSKALKGLKNTDKQSNKLFKTFKKLAGPLGTAAVIAGMVKLGKESVKAFAVQEQAEAKLNQTIKATGSAAGLTSDQLLDMASGLQGVTKYGDEAVIGAESLLLTFKNIGEKTFPRALDSILDVSEAMGVGLKESSIQLGKALNDPIGGIASLTRVGIQFTKSQKDLIKSLVETGDTAGAQNIILTELESQFGGVAKAAAATSTGALTQLNNSMGDLKEAMGESIAGGFEPLARATTKIIDKYNTWLKKNRDIKEAIDRVNAGNGSTVDTIVDLNQKIDTATISLQYLNSEYSDNVAGIEELRKAREDQIARLEAEKEATKQLAAEEARSAGMNKQGAAIQAKIAADRKASDEAYLELAKRIEDKRQAGLSDNQKEIESLQLQIDKNAELVKVLKEQGKSYEGVQALINEEVKERNKLQQNEIDSHKQKWLTKEEITAMGIQAEIDANKLIHDDIIKNDEDELEHYRQTQEAKLAILGQVSSTISSFSDLAVLGNNNEITSIEASIAAAKEKGEDTEVLENKKRDLLKKNWKTQKAFNLSAATIDGILAVQKALSSAPPPFNFILAALVGAASGANVAKIAGEEMPNFAIGGSFVTNGQQNITVGDNASGQERVTVEPIGGSDPGGSSGVMILNIDGQQFTGWLQDSLDNGYLRIPRRAIV